MMMAWEGHLIKPTGARGMPLSAMGYHSVKSSQIGGQARQPLADISIHLSFVSFFLFLLLLLFCLFYAFNLISLVSQRKQVPEPISGVNHDDFPGTPHRTQGMRLTWLVRPPSKYFQSTAAPSDLGEYLLNLPYCFYFRRSCSHPHRKVDPFRGKLGQFCGPFAMVGSTY